MSRTYGARKIARAEIELIPLVAVKMKSFHLLSFFETATFNKKGSLFDIWP
jgi:hypothetical protein